MLRYIISLFSERTAHPLLAVLLFLGAVFVVAGFGVEAFGERLTAGFLGVYASLAIAMGLVGYGTAFGVKLGRKLWRQYYLQL